MSSSARKDGDIAISEAMNNAMVTCMPLRNVVSYGFCSKEELLEMIDKMNEK
jgi:beta-glucosidase